MPVFDTNALADDAPVLRLWPGDPAPTAPFGDGDDARPRDGLPGVIDLWAVKYPAVSVYPANAVRGGPGVVVIPGGGYGMQSHTLEGIDVARRLADYGVTAFVLRYRLPDGKLRPGELPVPQQDALRAVQFVRTHAADFGVDPDRVGVLGFSAGGHLAAPAATLFELAPTLAEKAGHDAVSRASARPDFAVLAYAVVSMRHGEDHAGSRHNLVGENATPEQEARYSADAHVTPQTPPLFVFHAKDDAAVPATNVDRIAAAAHAAGVPCETLLFDTGGHGFGLSSPGNEAHVWFDRMLAWMRGRGIVRA